MRNVIRTLGKIGIWVVFPLLIVVAGAGLIGVVLPVSASVGITRFTYGVVIALVFIIPALLCKVWNKICEKAWGSQEELIHEQPDVTTVESVWKCVHCGTENSINYGQCKKCGKYK